jgi:tetratricopeptide (TPR) repeat protein
MALGRDMLWHGEASEALKYFQAAFKPPESLGEARHPLANCSDIYFYTGQAHAALGQLVEAREWWRRAAAARKDFQNMAVTEYSAMTYYSILAMRQLGRTGAAEKLLRAVRAYARHLEHVPAKIDYFATSLPTLLLFDTDLQMQQTHYALFLQAQMYAVEGKAGQTARLLEKILQSDPAHSLALDFRVETQSQSKERTCTGSSHGKYSTRTVRVEKNK